MGIFFILATIVQHNDPDWYLWGTVYIIPAIMSFIQAFGPSIAAHYVYQAFIRSCGFLYSLLVLIHGFYFLSNGGTFMASGSSVPLIDPSVGDIENRESLTILETEEGKEFLGSLIALIWIIISIYLTTTSTVGDSAISRRFKLLIFVFTISPLTLWFILYLLESNS
ncbi:transmembrane protein 220-like [Panonychus citri]|uniref:transmembrane protein 220-like n=1 Tax=Panonychus citri TaxID=50023 RepID=UPI002306F8AB|nr:transmembrane protein 220-like [Panonychus citri]